MADEAKDRFLLLHKMLQQGSGGDDDQEPPAAETSTMTTCSSDAPSLGGSMTDSSCGSHQPIHRDERRERRRGRSRRNTGSTSPSPTRTGSSSSLSLSPQRTTSCTNLKKWRPASPRRESTATVTRSASSRTSMVSNGRTSTTGSLSPKREGSELRLMRDPLRSQSDHGSVTTEVTEITEVINNTTASKATSSKTPLLSGDPEDMPSKLKEKLFDLEVQEDEDNDEDVKEFQEEQVEEEGTAHGPEEDEQEEGDEEMTRSEIILERNRRNISGLRERRSTIRRSPSMGDSSHRSTASRRSGGRRSPQGSLSPRGSRRTITSTGHAFRRQSSRLMNDSSQQQQDESTSCGRVSPAILRKSSSKRLSQAHMGSQSEQGAVGARRSGGLGAGNSDHSTSFVRQPIRRSKSRDSAGGSSVISIRQIEAALNALDQSEQQHRSSGRRSTLHRTTSSSLSPSGSPRGSVSPTRRNTAAGSASTSPGTSPTIERSPVRRTNSNVSIGAVPAIPRTRSKARISQSDRHDSTRSTATTSTTARTSSMSSMAVTAAMMMDDTSMTNHNFNNSNMRMSSSSRGHHNSTRIPMEDGSTHGMSSSGKGYSPRLSAMEDGSGRMSSSSKRHSSSMRYHCLVDSSDIAAKMRSVFSPAPTQKSSSSSGAAAASKTAEKVKAKLQQHVGKVQDRIKLSELGNKCYKTGVSKLASVEVITASLSSSAQGDDLPLLLGN